MKQITETMLIKEEGPYFMVNMGNVIALHKNKDTHSIVLGSWTNNPDGISCAEAYFNYLISKLKK